MFSKDSKFNHSALAWVIIVLLSLIFIVLVFKVGIMVGSSKPYFSSCGVDYTHKYISKNMDGEFMGYKKSTYANYQGVTELTATGFVTKDVKGNEQVVVVNEDTKIYKGEEKGGAEVSAGDKVYVDGDKDANGQIVASVIKIYDPELKEVKK